MTRELTVSAIQFDIKRGDLKHNLETVARLLKKSADRGTEMAVLPEMWPLDFDVDTVRALNESFTSDMLAFFSDLAKTLNMFIITGTMPEPRSGQIYNTSFLIGHRGELIGSYRKVHLFDGLAEKDLFSPGFEHAVFDTSVGKIGIAICFDLRFPELFRQMALSGAEAIFLPAQFPRPRQQHWEILLRARAIENQLFMVGCNRTGKAGSSTEYFGNSMLVGPYGQIIDEGGDGEEIVTATLDLEDLYEMRTALPTLTKIRPEVYPSSANSGIKDLRPEIPDIPQISSTENRGFNFKDTIHPMKPRQ